MHACATERKQKCQTVMMGILHMHSWKANRDEEYSKTQVENNANDLLR